MVKAKASVYPEISLSNTTDTTRSRPQVFLMLALRASLFKKWPEQSNLCPVPQRETNIGISQVSKSPLCFPFNSSYTSLPKPALPRAPGSPHTGFGSALHLQYDSARPSSLCQVRKMKPAAGDERSLLKALRRDDRM